jgi:hypothetical protein
VARVNPTAVYVTPDPLLVPERAENQPPIIQGLMIHPSPVTRPGSITLTPAGLSDPDGIVTMVEFYRDTVLLGSNEDGNDNWSLTVGTAGWPVGEFNFSARVQDDEGAWSELVVVKAIVASWQNPTDRFDVVGSGYVSAMDVLAIINEINRVGSRDLQPRSLDDLDLPYFDVNGDGRLTAADVLAVINHINQGGSGGGGEGEPLPSLPGGWLPSAERLDGYNPLEPASVPTPARANATPGHEPADNLVFTVPIRKIVRGWKSGGCAKQATGCTRI